MPTRLDPLDRLVSETTAVQTLWPLQHLTFAATVLYQAPAFLTII